MADAAQMDLKLLSFEFLFRSRPAPSNEQAQAFQERHHNDWLKQFKRDFAQGFDELRLRWAIVDRSQRVPWIDEAMNIRTFYPPWTRETMMQRLTGSWRDFSI